MALAFDPTRSSSARASGGLLAAMTLEVRLRTIRKRRLASRLSGVSASALWIAGFAALVILVSAEILNIH